MNRTFVPYYLFLLVMISISSGLKSQNPAASGAAEDLLVYTDRTMYIAGEKIQFSAFVLNENNIKAGITSRVLYSELIRPDGNRIAGGKYTIENSSA